MHIVIIGNGIAGVTAARHIRKLSDHPITMISAESEHFFSRTALMYLYMGHMTFENIKPYEDWFWEKNRIDLVNAYVQSIDVQNKKLMLDSQDTLAYDKLIIASGSRSNMFDWPGRDLAGVQGLYSIQDLENMEDTTRGIDHAVVVGGGLIGIEMVEMLHSRHIPVTFLVREHSFFNIVLPPEESAMINRHMDEHGIDLKLGTGLKEIKGRNGQVQGVITDQGEEIPCQFAGIAIGVSPNIDFLAGSGIETDKGILVDKYLETNIEDVYAIGDCAQIRSPSPHRKAIEPVWYAGRMMGETIAPTITGKRTAYKPGVWFNSAKFFDIEYQTYGYVPNYDEDDNVNHVYWEHKDGKKCIRIVFSKEGHALLGINTLGIRVRHEVIDRWIREQRQIGYVMQHLNQINFEPEFSERFEDNVVKVFNQTYPQLAVEINNKRNFLKKIFA